ncbi:MAG: GWxTD domain-containing protein, partial [Candidatus Latescibacteria bacterium]|nr:GWxTD domain-containing protein [Candidatus Latescibacterota bacterium]
MGKGLLSGLLWLLFCVCTEAATVLLTDGSVLKGDVVSETDDRIVLRTLLGELSVDRKLIQMLKLENASGESEEADIQVVLSDDFGKTQDEVARALVATAANADTAAFYRALDREEKGPFLVRFWQVHNPLMLKYYFGYYMGRRHFTVSDAYFERGGVIPSLYLTRAEPPAPELIEAAIRLCKQAVNLMPQDPVALCALGYVKLEKGSVGDAEKLFLKALQKHRKFAEARNGRALAMMKMPGRKDKAMDLAHETVALDREYVAALYTRAMCHLVRMGKDRVDMDHYLEKVLEKAPGHYDAHFKLGAFYESLRYLDKAAAEYSRQLEVNPAHKTAPERLARVAMMRRAEGKTTYAFADLQVLAKRDPLNHLPLLAEALVKREDWSAAEDAFKQYLDLIDGEERLFYEDLSLVATAEELSELERALGSERARLLRKFWVVQDPTPTSPVNERWVEHCLRVHHARLHFADGIKAWHGRGWDRRGDVYVRFGAPDHRSWSDNLVFETDPKVAKVKNRLNNLAYAALEEVQPSKHLHGSSDRAFGYGAESETAEIRGRPTFPIPMRTSVMNDGSELNYKWESWIYANIGEGFEITFLDPTGEGLFDFAPMPPNSRHWALWQQLAPETIVAKVTNRTPSIYAFDYGGEPLDLYLYTANFQGERNKTALEVYMG